MAMGIVTAAEVEALAKLVRAGIPDGNEREHVAAALDTIAKTLRGYEPIVKAYKSETERQAGMCASGSCGFAYFPEDPMELEVHQDYCDCGDLLAIERVRIVKVP